jgi:hypothetical protein
MLKNEEEPVTGSAMWTDTFPHDFIGIGAVVSASV